jgi:hypothetical protein
VLFGRLEKASGQEFGHAGEHALPYPFEHDLVPCRLIAAPIVGQLPIVPQAKTPY